MDAPLDHEAANADLITDIAPGLNRSADVPELARELASDTAAWREAWAVDTQEAASEVEPTDLTSQTLSYDEDEELRRLNYLAEIGTLAGLKAERLIELRLRDRRGEIRPPREFAEENLDGQTKRKWYQFRSR